MATYQLDEERLHQLLLAAVQAGAARRGGWASSLLLLALCAAALGAAVYLTWRRRQQDRRRLEVAASVADGEHLRRFCNVLPAWALNPDASSCLWINNLLAQAWPHLERFGCRFLKSGDFLESQINATTFWRPPVLRSSYIKVQGVALGQEPPRVTGIKAFPKQGGLHDELLIEQSFVWDSKMEIKLLVTLLGNAMQLAKAGGSASGGAWAALQSLLSRASRVRVGVSNLAVRGTVRLSLKPLLDDFPFAGSAKVSLVGTPEFSYQLNVLGGDPYLVPGIKLWVDSFMQETVLLPFTFPDGFIYDLTTHTVAPVEKPEGLLEVAVVEARNVPRMDFFGKSDPYVRLWVRESQKLHTATRSRTLSPVWNESFTFLVHSSQHQQLSLALYDSDMWPNTDDLIGKLCLPVSSLDLSPGAVNDLWLPVPRNGKRGKGAEERQRVAAARAASGGVVRADSGGGSGKSAAAGAQRRGHGALRRHSSPGSPAAVARSQVMPGAPSGGRAPPSPFASEAARHGVEAPGPAAGQQSAQPPAGQQQQLQEGQGAGAPETQPSTMSSGLLASTNEAWQQLRHLALNPLDALRSKDCMLHIVATFYPLSEQEIAAVEREASRQHRGEGTSVAPSRTGSLLADSPVHNMLRGGVLYVYLDRADNLSSSKGFTRNMRVDVSVGELAKSTERGKVPFRHRSNPVFEETVELVVPGAVAQQRGAQVEVEVWVEHYLRKASFKGRTSVPLQRVIQHKRVRDTWPLRDSPSGRPSTLTAEFRWLSTMAAAADVRPF